MSTEKEICLLGFASDVAGARRGSADGPFFMQKSACMTALNKLGILFTWHDIIKPKQDRSILQIVASECQFLAQKIKNLVQKKQFFAVIGGDHSSAIGTWSGASYAIKDEGSLGLIWIDAHMDSHTPETSETGNIHGMPLACLLGYGDAKLTGILDETPKVKPEHVCLVGIRSYEPGEAALLEKLGIRIFYMDEIRQRGLDVVMRDAVSIAKTGTTHFGLSIDIDSLDPSDAPGTGTQEPNGIYAEEMYNALQHVAEDSQLIGIEIAEFDPHRDVDAMTEKVIVNMISSILLNKRALG